MPKSKFAFYFDITNTLIIFMHLDLTNAFPRSLGSSLTRDSTVFTKPRSDKELSNRSFAAGGHMVQNPKYWRAKECAKTLLGNINKEKSHFSS